MKKAKLFIYLFFILATKFAFADQYTDFQGVSDDNTPGYVLHRIQYQGDFIYSGLVMAHNSSKIKFSLNEGPSKGYFDLFDTDKVYYSNRTYAGVTANDERYFVSQKAKVKILGINNFNEFAVEVIAGPILGSRYPSVKSTDLALTQACTDDRKIFCVDNYYYYFSEDKILYRVKLLAIFANGDLQVDSGGNVYRIPHQNLLLTGCLHNICNEKDF